MKTASAKTVSAKAASAKTAASREAVAKKPVAKKPIAKKPVLKKTPAATAAKKKASPPVSKKASRPSGGAPMKPVAASAVPFDPARLRKVLAVLTRMGDKRPVRVTSLKRALKSFLGTSASEEIVGAVFDALVAEGAVVVGATGGATYPSIGRVLPWAPAT